MATYSSVGMPGMVLRGNTGFASAGWSPVGVHGIESHPVIDPTAIIGEEVVIGKNVVIGPRVTIEDAVTIGDGVRIEAGVCIGKGSRIGAGSFLGPHVTIRERTLIGQRVQVQAGAVLGSDGFGFASCTDGNKMKVPQVGNVVVGDDVVIEANAAIDRATMGETRIGNRVHIGSLVQIGHNVVIGDDSVIGPLSGISGSTVLGRHVQVGAHCGIVGHIRVEDHAVLQDGCGVTRSVKAGSVVAGMPAVSVDRFSQYQAALQQLPRLEQTLRALERRAETLLQTDAVPC